MRQGPTAPSFLVPTFYTITEQCCGRLDGTNQEFLSDGQSVLQVVNVLGKERAINRFGDFVKVETSLLSSGFEGLTDAGAWFVKTDKEI